MKQKNNTPTTLFNHLQPAIAGALCLTAYFPTLIWMWDRWFARDSYYSHGILVPLVTIFLIWQKKEQLKETPYEESPWGIRLIVLGIIIHLISSLLRVYFTSGFSLLIVIAGIINYFYGKKVLHIIIFPIAFLFFMMPLPLVVITNISFQLKILAAQIATFLLNEMRIPAIREGSIIKMRSVYVIVDDVCSGLRSLISLAALGSIFAYWMKGSLNKKVLLFLSTIPIAVITNVVRVIFLSAVSEIWGLKYADGLVHDISGFLVFGLAFILLYAVAKLLE